MSALAVALVLLAVAVAAWPRPSQAALIRLRPATFSQAAPSSSMSPHRTVGFVAMVRQQVVHAAAEAEPARLRVAALGIGSAAAGFGTVAAGWAAGGSAGVATGVGTLLAARAVATAEEHRRLDGVIEAVGALTAELRAGQSTSSALASTAGSAHPWVAGALRAAAATASLGGSVPSALLDHAHTVRLGADARRSPRGGGRSSRGDPVRRAGARLRAVRRQRRTVDRPRHPPGPDRPTDEGGDTGPTVAALRRLAAAWQLCERSGASLADVLEALESDLRSRRSQDQLLVGLLAGPKATAALLAGLPALGLLMGSAMGADPWHVLTETPTGRIVLIVGVCLETLGLLWTSRIVAGVRGAH